GKYWNQDNIDAKTLDRIEKIISGEYDEKIRNRVREKAINLTDVSLFRGLPIWLACYIVYDRHSEASDIQKWEKPEDIDQWLRDFKQHSLRNPIVKQVVTETMRTVRDIWQQVGSIDEIHVELGREMKNPADKRKKMTERNNENENTNLRIKAMLMEFQNPEFGIENVRPYSPTQQDILRIYEEGALLNLSNDDSDFEFVSKISKAAQPSKNDVLRYKCWLEQKYRSPYTDEMISLAKLFTPAYEIEHIIPQSRYFDDSFSNKVICEAEVNKLKDNQLGFEFIKNHKGEKVTLTGGKVVEILTIEKYQKFVKDHYAKNPSKMKHLLMDDIPDKFIERQLNDSRYISKYIKGILSNIVRERDENGNMEQEAVSKNLISCNGNITDRLKKDWGMNDVWNRIILPRFIRLNELTNSTHFTTVNTSGEIIPAMPLELQKGFNKKRIDHRHHAMDAIVIACTTRDHVNLLNNESALSEHKENRYALSHKLRRYEEVIINGEKRKIPKEFLKPWETFTQDAQSNLENIVVSFKQNLRVINKTVNHYQHFEDGKKVMTKQEKGENWAIRKSMHKDTVFGEVNLRFKKEVSLNEALKNPKAIVNKDFKEKVLELLGENRDAKYIKKYVEDNKEVWSDINLKKIEVYYFSKDTKERYFATRKPLDTSFNKKKIEDSVTDTGIQKILLAHLEAKSGDAELAFSPDGIDEMNRNIVALNKGKFHQPILKVRVYEKADKFSVGQTGNKGKKFVEADKGTKLYTFFYNKQEDDGTITRKLIPVSFIETFKIQKEFGCDWIKKMDEKIKEDNHFDTTYSLNFTMSPTDLVYVPTESEISTHFFDYNPNNIYKVVSLDDENPNFILASIASMIIDKQEFTRHNKTSRSLDGRLIKNICIPIKVDRLGNIIEFNGLKI
ncbi:MAG: type II CRISPR RNA-guided endonuclease Cas9, partial [Bacteroidales bacterium]|nr:type II CRISPR RNA-guided endonuclease Cas9 [Bacteroidales bacterium]